MSFTVYCFRNLTKGHCYVGSSVRFTARKKEHVYLLRSNKHHNLPLQRAWNKYGEADFVIEVLEETIPCDRTLRQQEQAWMDLLRLLGVEFYNLCPTTTHTTLGVKFGPRSEEVKQKISRSTTGKKRTAETKQLLSDMLRGRVLHAMPHTQATKEQMSRAKRGRVWVNDGEKTRLVSPSVAKELLASGFSYGRI